MKKTTLFLFILFLFSCTKDNLKSLDVNKKDIKISNSISFEFRNKTDSNYSSKTPGNSKSNDDFYYDIKLKNIKIFDKNKDDSFTELVNHAANEYFRKDYSVYGQKYQLDVPAFSIPLKWGAHSLFTISEISLDYGYSFKGNKNENNKDLDVNLLCAGPLKEVDDYEHVSDFVNITKESDVLELDSELKIVNGPLIMRFEELCNHPLKGSSSNPHWRKTRNKALEYFVFVDYYKRNSGDILNAKFTSDSYREDKYKIVVFYHSVFLYKEEGDRYKLISSSKEGDGNRSIDFDNEGYCDIQLSDLDMAKVRICVRYHQLKKFRDSYYADGSIAWYFYSMYNGDATTEAQKLVDLTSNNISTKIGSVWSSSNLREFETAKRDKWISDGRIETEVGKIKKYLIHLRSFDGRISKSRGKEYYSSNSLSDLSIECLLDSEIYLK
ncbi:MAG: hypothetical protein WBG43_12490 [Marinifilaceae bacterium]